MNQEKIINNISVLIFLVSMVLCFFTIAKVVWLWK